MNVVKELMAIILIKKEENVSEFKEIILIGVYVLKIMLFLQNGEHYLSN